MYGGINPQKNKMCGGHLRFFFHSVPPKDFKWNSPKAKVVTNIDLYPCHIYPILQVKFLSQQTIDSPLIAHNAKIA